MFNRTVHHLDENGRLVRITPFTEVMMNGKPSLIVKNDMLLTTDGQPYPVDMLVPHIKDRYQHLIDKNTKQTEEPKKLGRPKKTALEVEEG